MSRALEGEREGGPVVHPTHYHSHPSGVACVDVIELLPGNLANAVKYAWRRDGKGNPLQDLKKCAWYLSREIEYAERVAHIEWPWRLAGQSLVEMVVVAEEPGSVLAVVLARVNQALLVAGPIGVPAYVRALRAAIDRVEVAVSILRMETAVS